MGFFEGAVLLPHPLTWMDKVIVECVDSLCCWEEARPACEEQQGDARASDGDFLSDLKATG